jgi:hypothetical protein
LRLAARSRVGSDSVYDYIIAEMSKAVKKQVLCIAPCYFAQSGSKDVRRRRRADTPVTEHARPTPCKRVPAAPVKARRPGAAPRVRRAAKNRSLQKKKKSQWWCLRLSSDSQKRAGGDKRRRAA